MTAPSFSPARSAAMRELLIERVAATRARRTRRIATGAALVAAGAVAGGGAAAATAEGWRPVPSLPPAPPVVAPATNPGVPAPAGTTPGQPIVSLLGGVETLEVDGAERIVQLDAPAGASHVRVAVTCTSTGTTAWGFDAGGNNPSVECVRADLAKDERFRTAWMDFALEGDLLYVQPRDGASSIVTVQYLALVETAWGVNARGETYGAAKPGFGEPDLVAAVGTDAGGREVLGYLRRSDSEVMFPGQPLPSSPAEALELQERRTELYPDGWDVPLFAADGVTRVGTMRVG